MTQGTLSAADLEAWADEILAAAKPVQPKRRQPPAVQGEGPRRPGSRALEPKQKQLSLVQTPKRMSYAAELSKADYEAVVFSMRWAAEHNERTQDRMFTISWSWSPLDGIWYAWTWAHDAEASTLRAAIDRLLEHYGVKR